MGSVAEPNGGIADPSGVWLRPMGSVAEPNGGVADPSAAEPKGDWPRPIGSVAEPSGVWLQLKGSVLEPSGVWLRAMDDVREPATGGVMQPELLLRPMFTSPEPPIGGVLHALPIDDVGELGLGLMTDGGALPTGPPRGTLAKTGSVSFWVRPMPLKKIGWLDTGGIGGVAVASLLGSVTHFWELPGVV